MIRAATLSLLALVQVAWADPIAQERIDVRVTIAPSPDGVTAHYNLAQPVARMPLEYSSSPTGKGEWAVTTPGVSYERGQIRGAGGRLFDTFDVVAPARNELSGPYYPCVMKIGPGGRVIYASCFAAHQDEFRTTITFEPPKGNVVMGLPHHAAQLTIDRTFYDSQAGPLYAYIGPRTYVHRSSSADYVVGPDAPAWIAPHIRKIAERVLPFYTKVTGVALRRKPLFLITTEPSDETSMAAQADVTDGPNVAVRIFGEGWKKGGELAVSSLDHTIAHETAHFWNGHHFRSQKSDEAPWLHEGGADYWALVAQRRLGLTGEKDPTALLNQCIDLLGPDSLKRGHAKVAYACGATQWFADLGEQGRGRDIFALWREMFARAEANGGYYSAAMFRSLAEETSPAVGNAFRLIFEPGDPSRWNELPPLLATLGVKIESAPFPPDWVRNRIVFHLLKQVCTGPGYGKRNFDDHFVLDAGDDCGPLSGGPEVDMINGVNLFTDPLAAHEVVKAACEAKATVTLTRTSNQQQQRTMTCTVPLPPLPPAFRIAAGS